MEKRILIKEDLHLFRQIATDLKQFMPVLNEIKASFEGLEIGAFTNEIFKETVLLGPKKYIEIYVKNLNNQLDKLEITISVIRQNAIKDHENVIERFKKAVDDAKRFYPEIYSANRPKLTIKFISYEKGLFVISKEDKEMILEDFCRIYIDNEEESKLLEVVERLKEAFNEYLDFYKTTGIPNVNSFLTITEVFKIDEDRKFITDPMVVKNLISFKKRHEAYILERNEKNQKRIDAQRV